METRIYHRASTQVFFETNRVPFVVSVPKKFIPTEDVTRMHKFNERAEYLYAEGNMYARMGQVEVALNLYEAAIAIDDRNPMYYNNKAASLKRLGRMQAALEQYEQIATKFPEYGKVYLSMASTYIEVGNYQSAVKSYQSFLAAYKKGNFFFNPVVGGISQILYGDSEIETIVMTSINYLSSEEQEQALQAFQEAQS
jgi:tetratricopeptide (TPR) repeat protein